MQGGTAPSDDYAVLESNILKLTPYNPKEISELEDEKEIAWDFGWSNSEREIFKGILAEKYNELGINYDTKLISRDIEDSIDLLREKVNEGINAMAGFYEGQLDSNGNLITNKKGIPILRKEVSEESKNKYDIKSIYIILEFRRRRGRNYYFCYFAFIWRKRLA